MGLLAFFAEMFELGVVFQLGVSLHLGGNSLPKICDKGANFVPKAHNGGKSWWLPFQ